ncbi:bifunctional phosphopantothenoylcysteine decarboxylase/phosphopantothenate--cysteine ligase CoaBC [Clostridium gasigenes]|uniref:Coenzyme A biosynthesis bifunctional protein CoaBC n=1 Tax=Clostridium gasigenes TaxID=94869 RepID=A0A7X0SF15_9CLOT|nr:bifunctional phosphopantothenoylcysteine decarboxylase/phosphopantothenate--cysteine ligase CoaBC [Clostridium gasigenes]MBB6715147.1 bifunctional phosphopantothenoylcysteine decarboxylase/phosphopantothenate--cysteine ligase CoaBC [Clostridium gasigenes]
MKSKKCVVIGVSGGIAVYKALDIISALKKQDVDVRVIMTKSATEFVTPLSFQSLSQNMVATDMFAEPKAFEIQHISLAQKADLMLIAPATANIIGKVVNGIADDMLSTTIMATKAKVIFAPAMNTNMYENVIVQSNIEKLISYGYEFITPGSGRLACGDVGVGKLADVNIIVNKVLEELNKATKKQDLKGKKVLVSAGPTIAQIDPVRFITNRSTGKMGYNLAQEAKDRGAEVVLVSGPTSLENPKGVKVINVNTNDEMKDAILEHFHNSDIVIKAAAVADYKPKEYSTQKIKKGDEDLNLVLTRDNDILKLLGDKKTHQLLVGFAAESNNVIENAKKKLEKKNLDFIVANDITAKETGFGSDDNKVIIISSTGEKKELDKMSKKEVASNIFDTILEKR